MSEENITTLYSDGIGKIHFFGNMLRLDLMEFVPSDGNDPNAKPEPKVTSRIVMSPNAFLASYESFMNMIDKLAKAGILSKAEETVQTADEAQPREEKPEVHEEQAQPKVTTVISETADVKVEEVK